MGLFPDDFPFNRKRAPEPAEPAADVRQPSPSVDDVTYEPVPVAPAEAAAEPSSVAAEATAPSPLAAPRTAPEPVVRDPAAVVNERAPEEPPLDPMPATEPPQVLRERRRSPRQAMRARAILKNDTGRGAPVNVELDNISMLGVRFRSSQPLGIGDRANIRLEVGPLRWATRFRVVTCQQEPKTRRFLIGAQFVGNELARERNTAAA